MNGQRGIQIKDFAVKVKNFETIGVLEVFLRLLKPHKAVQGPVLNRSIIIANNTYQVPTVSLTMFSVLDTPNNYSSIAM